MIKGLTDKDYYYSRLKALHLTTLLKLGIFVEI